MSRHSFTRQELYDLVWAEPIAQLATRFGISGRGLAKACARAGIPVPERGHWAKVQAGQKVRRAALMQPRPGQSDTITIDPPGAKPETPPPPPPPLTVAAKIAEEQRPEKKVTVPATLSNPHRIVAAWLAEERESQAQARRNRWSGSLFEPRYASEVAKRRLRILSTLFKALEARGYRLLVERYSKYDVQAELNNDRLEIMLNERMRQFRRYLTEEEMRKRGDLSTGRKWTQEREATGELVLKMKEARGYGWSKEWSDTPDLPLEDRLNDTLGGIAAGFEEIRLRHEREAVEQRKRWAEEQERHRQEMERKRETIRFRRLVQSAEAWQTAGRIRAYVEEVRNRRGHAATAQEGPELDQWAQWALAHADRIDPLLSDNLLNLTVSDSDVWSMKD